MYTEDDLRNAVASGAISAEAADALRNSVRTSRAAPAYVLAALTFLFDRFGAVELNVALTALVIGSALLTLSAFWSPIRRMVVKQLPNDLQDRLPATLVLAA